jgi:hypothetical protein
VAFLGFLNSSSATPGIAAAELDGLETGDLYQNGRVDPDLTVYRQSDYVGASRLRHLNS